MKLRRFVVGWLVCLGLLFGGPSLAAGRADRMEPGTGLAFGSFDVTDSDLAVTHVTLMRIKPARMYMGSSGEKATVTYTDGKFYSANLAPGLYAVMGFFSGDKFFSLQGALRDNRFEVTPGKVAYAGSYKLALTKGGLFRRDKGSFERIGSPVLEASLLQWLAQELKGSDWASTAASGLAEKKGK